MQALSLWDHMSEKVKSNQENSKEQFDYRLFAVVLHQGGRAEHGHYLAICRTGQDNDSWYWLPFLPPPNSKPSQLVLIYCWFSWRHVVGDCNPFDLFYKICRLCHVKFIPCAILCFSVHYICLVIQHIACTGQSQYVNISRESSVMGRRKILFAWEKDPGRLLNMVHIA